MSGVYLNEDDCAKLRSKLVDGQTNKDNVFRLVECIDRAETQRKVAFLINATRCLLTDFIDLQTYFRICYMITHNLEEDLLFLAEHIFESELPYSMYTQGLLSTGLMYQSIIDADGEQKYSFTLFAGMVDQYAISYDNIERYPNPRNFVNEFADPQPKLNNVIRQGTIPTISEEDIENLFK